MNVYLDDERQTPEGWVRCYTPEEAIGLIQQGGVTCISLDNDLALCNDAFGRVREGYVVANWIETQVAVDPTFVPPEVRVHSANPVARRRMDLTIQSIQRLLARR